MTDDLVKRLRCYADIDSAVYHPWVYGEAADRIEKLEAALREIEAMKWFARPCEIAHAALAGEQDQ